MSLNESRFQAPELWLSAEYPYLIMSADGEVAHHFIIGDEGKFWYFSQQFAEDVGVEIGTVLRHPFIDHLHPDDREASAMELERAHETNGPQTFMARFGCADGTWRWYVWTLLRPPGQPSLFGAAMDATRRRRLSEVPAPETASKQWDAPADETQTILVAEDVDSVREVMRRMLASKGYHVLTAHHGEEAVRLAREFDGPIHVLITDICLPGLCGQELAATLAGERPELRTIYVTGFIDDELGLVQGETVLRKPFEMKELLEHVRESTAR